MAELTLKLADVPDGRGTVVVINDRLKIALFRVGDRCAAINNRCPHAGGALGEGQFDGTKVKCPLHGFVVDVWRGIGNAGKPVKTYPVAVRGDDVCITLPDPA
jgi:nitrite reductase/ring-hydroxylating ferredoxin subunit